MSLRPLIAALLACLALGLAACGGDDNDEPAKEDTTEQATTSTAPQDDPAAKLEMQRAVTGYNAGYREFRVGIREAGGDLDRLKAAIADYRTVIYEFDKDLRAITFDDSLVPQVNSILESNRDLIAQLDEMRNAGDFDEVIAEFQAFQRDRTPTINAVNRLLGQL